MQQVASFGVFVILSRILPPSDFGIIAIMNVYIAFILIFTNIGLVQL